MFQDISLSNSQPWFRYFLPEAFLGKSAAFRGFKVGFNGLDESIGSALAFNNGSARGEFFQYKNVAWCGRSHGKPCITAASSSALDSSGVKFVLFAMQTILLRIISTSPWLYRKTLPSLPEAPIKLSWCSKHSKELIPFNDSFVCVDRNLTKDMF